MNLALVVSPEEAEGSSLLWKKPDFKIWVANQNITVTCHIDSFTWIALNCGQKVVVQGTTVLIVKK